MVKAVRESSLRVRLFLALQFSIPAAVYAVRVIDGTRLAPWGWQMFS